MEKIFILPLTFHQRVWKLFFIIFIIHGTNTTNGTSDLAYSRLRNSLLVGYDPNLRPMPNANTTELWIYFRPRSFDVDETSSTFTLNGVLNLVWKDSAIRWDPALFENITYIRFETEQLWRPSLTVFNNAATRKFEEIHSMGMSGNFKGMILWAPIVKFKVRCTHDLKRFPFDSNQCNVRIGSFSHSGDEVYMLFSRNFTTMNLNVSRLQFNPDWETTSVKVQIRDKIFECCPNYQEYNIEWNLRRRSSFHFAIIFAPAIGIAIMILTSFWMSPSSIQRLGLLVVVTLINTSFLSYVHDRIPANGDETPLVILYYRDSLIMIILAFIWTIINRSLATTKRKQDIPLPGVVIRFLESWPSKVLCLDSRPEPITNLTSSIDQDWTWLALLADRLVFFLYLFVYFIFILAFL